MDIIVWLIIIFVIYNKIKKKKEKEGQQRGQRRTSQPNYRQQTYDLNQMQATMTRKQQELKNRLQQKYATASGTTTGTKQQNTSYRTAQQNVPYQPTQWAGYGQPVQQPRQTQQSVQTARQEQPARQAQAAQKASQQVKKKTAQQGDIRERAAANARANEEDKLETNQLQEVNGSAIDVQNITGTVDIEKSSELMDRLNDLMIMGYQADLSFERDFLSEGIELLNRYELPTI